MDTTFKIFAILSPFIASYLIYWFSIRGKRKDIDFQKERELNTVLSNLLVVWHYLTRIETVLKILNGEDLKSVVPKKYFPSLILQTGFLNDKCFKELDNSIDLLKKYEPIIYFKLEGTGNAMDIIREKYIMPFFKSSDIQPELINAGTDNLLRQTLNDLEDHLEMVADKIDVDTLSGVRTFIHNNRVFDQQEMLDRMNSLYYEQIMALLPENFGKKPTFEEFIDFAKTKEYEEILKLQFDLIVKGMYDEFLQIVSKNPNITLEEIHAELEIKRLAKL